MLLDADAWLAPGLRGESLRPSRHGQDGECEGAGRVSGATGLGLQLRRGHRLSGHGPDLRGPGAVWGLGLLRRVQPLAGGADERHLPIRAADPGSHQEFPLHRAPLEPGRAGEPQCGHLHHPEPCHQGLRRASEAAGQLEAALQTGGYERAGQRADRRGDALRGGLRKRQGPGPEDRVSLPAVAAAAQRAAALRLGPASAEAHFDAGRAPVAGGEGRAERSVEGGRGGGAATEGGEDEHFVQAHLCRLQALPRPVCGPLPWYQCQGY
mmetsp:Transcript_20848/g.49478  ORF Transcript_20848/g.49478 Transcript_20848/m.49478 type:complete len:267 (-) Transcript_20848:5017-5817(-)